MLELHFDSMYICDFLNFVTHVILRIICEILQTPAAMVCEVLQDTCCLGIYGIIL